MINKSYENIGTQITQSSFKMNYADLNTPIPLYHQNPMIVQEPDGDYYSKNNYPLQEESYKIIGACMEVHKELGKGFLEAVYHEALCIELTKRGIPFESYKRLYVFYKDVKLKKTFTADIYAYDQIIVELKAFEGSLDGHTLQVINYLSATKNGLGLLFNFGTSSLQYKRIIVSKYLKNYYNS